MITDDILLAAHDAMRPDRIQGFKYGDRYVVRDVWLPREEQELWIGTDEKEFEKQCKIERMRLAYNVIYIGNNH